MLSAKTYAIIQRTVIGALVLITISACGDYSYRWQRMKYTEYNKPKERTLGIIHLDDISSANDIEVHLTKKRGGYGIETPLYKTDFGNVNAVVSKSRDYHYFTGVQMRLSF